VMMMKMQINLRILKKHLSEKMKTGNVEESLGPVDVDKAV
jgi:hypothetical protein